MDRQTRPGIIQEQGDYGIFSTLNKKDQEKYRKQYEEQTKKSSDSSRTGNNPRKQY